MGFPLMLATPLLDIVGKVIDRVIPDKAAAEKAKLEMMSDEAKREFELMIAQIEVNKEEAKSTNWFVAGGRPLVMWVCGFGLAYASIIEPILRFAAKVVFGYTGEFPEIDTNLTIQVLMGMLGFGAYRTIEKIKGAEGNR